MLNARPIDFIADGGSENNNKTVEQFIRKFQVDITKKIALKDIRQSNAMTELMYLSSLLLSHKGRLSLEKDISPNIAYHQTQRPLQLSCHF